MIKLVDVYSTGDSFGILYELLKERTPEQSISHKSMPTMEEHVNFVQSVPYRAWFLILSEESLAEVGSIYLTDQNEIGVFIFNEYQGMGYAAAAINQIREMYRGPYYANINPANKASKKMFESLGFKHIQDTYRYG